jgi:hypothetical protein
MHMVFVDNIFEGCSLYPETHCNMHDDYSTKPHVLTVGGLCLSKTHTKEDWLPFGNVLCVSVLSSIVPRRDETLLQCNGS